jgi:hypothetical protein
MHTWKYHKEILYTYIKETKISFIFSKMRYRNVNQVLSGGGYQRNGGGYKERV